MEPRFTAAIFDLDGTITDSSPLHWKTFNEALAPHGVRIDRKTWDEEYEGTSALHVITDALARHGVTAAAEPLRERRRVLFHALAEERLVPVAGFARFFDGLRALGVPTIVATNAEQDTIRLSIRLLKLEGERTLSSRETDGRLKPDPAIYLLACERLGKRPEACVVFEDSVWGVMAAKRAGCYCVALLTTTTKERLEAAGADLIVQDYTKLSPGLLFAPE